MANKIPSKRVLMKFSVDTKKWPRKRVWEAVGYLLDMACTYDKNPDFFERGLFSTKFLKTFLDAYEDRERPFSRQFPQGFWIKRQVDWLAAVYQATMKGMSAKQQEIEIFDFFSQFQWKSQLEKLDAFKATKAEIVGKGTSCRGARARACRNIGILYGISQSKIEKILKKEKTNKKREFSPLGIDDWIYEEKVATCITRIFSVDPETAEAIAQLVVKSHGASTFKGALGFENWNGFEWERVNPFKKAGRKE